MTLWAWASLYGTGLGLGVLMLVLRSPRWQFRAVRRLAPYLSDVSAGAFRVVSEARARRTAGWLRAWLPEATHLDAAMRLAGWAGGAGRGRALATTAALLGSASGAVALLFAPVALTARLLLVPIGAGLGLGLFRLALGRAGRRRRQRIESEIPTVLEFLSLSVSAGEALPDALARVARVGQGDLVREIAEIVRQAQLGVPLAAVLRESAAELRVPAFSRLSEQLVGALERGNPLAEVLRAQTADARVQLKRHLLESAGRKEIAMLVPLVFLILPVTVLFALWPGIALINTGW